MEATLHALSGILLRAVPTFILVILLHFFLKYSFFRPLDAVLKKRYEATEGARRRAEEMVEKAAAKTQEYDAAMRSARAEIYQAQEQLHQKLEEERRAEVAAARTQAEGTIRQSRAQLAGDVEQAKQELSRESEMLAARIADAIVGRSVA